MFLEGNDDSLSITVKKIFRNRVGLCLLFMNLYRNKWLFVMSPARDKNKVKMKNPRNVHKYI